MTEGAGCDMVTGGSCEHNTVLLVYAVELTDDERRAATDYLRTRYGPA